MEPPEDKPDRPATIEDLLAMPDRGRGYEIIDGRLVKKHSSPQAEALRQRLRSSIELVALIDSVNRQVDRGEDDEE